MSNTPSRKTVPNKRSTELENKIIKHIREGATFSDAPRLEGIDESSFRRWRKCKNDQGEGDATLRDRRCWNCANCALQRRCDEAESGFKNYCVQIIHKAMPKHWKAAAWLLEHRWREDYSLKSKVEAAIESESFDPSREFVRLLFADSGEEPEAGIKPPSHCVKGGTEA